MSRLKKLAGQTAIYGLPSILGRFLNYLLVPLYTQFFIPSEYGIINDVYALVAFVAVVLPWGMETAYFRFSNKKEFSSQQVFQTTLTFVLFSSLLFWGAIWFFLPQIAGQIGYPQNPEYLLWMGSTLVFDALSVIPLAQLRNENRAKKFAVVNFVGILTNIGLNLFFIGYCLPLHLNGAENTLTHLFFDASIGVGYVFLANMMASGVKFLLLLPAYRQLTFSIHFSVLKELLIYASPLVIAGFAGIINETLDRRLIRVILEPSLGTEGALAQVGIYGAVYKLAILITLFTQAFRYAAEPFFFARETDQDATKVYADVLKWYTIVTTTLFLIVMLFIDFFKQFIRSEAYWEGLYIVPILLFANIFLGWIYNLSVWYKLSQKTIYGAVLAVFGAAITVSMNMYLIPKIGYEGAAWATFASYGSMAVLSYFLGRKNYPIPYEVFKILGYSLLAALIWFGSTKTPHLEGPGYYFVQFIWLLAYVGMVGLIERNEIKKLLPTK